MKKITYIHLLFSLLFTQTLLAQDKLFLRNNTTIYCKISSVNEKTVSYRDTLGNPDIKTISKESIMLAEFKSGDVYIFGKANENSSSDASIITETRQERKIRKMEEWKKEEETLSDNILGFEPGAFFLGRFGVSYERLFANKSIGIKIPLIMSYNYAQSSGLASNNGNTTLDYGPSFITGLDVNFYQDLKPKTKYFFGPRIRYGKDMFLGGIEGFTAQLNNGLFVSQGKNFTNTIGVGIGCFKQTLVYNSTNNSSFSDEQLYPSFSITWRLGFRL